MPWTRAVRVVAAHECTACGGASRADVEVGEPHALVVEIVDIWGAEDRIAVAGKVTVALVIGDDENDIGPVCGSEGMKGESAQESGGGNESVHELVVRLRGYSPQGKDISMQWV